MKNPKLVYNIVAETVKAIRKPVTVKIRKGFDEQSLNAVEICKGHRSGRGISNCGTQEEPENSIIPARQTGRLSDR